MDKTKIFMESIGQLGLTKSQFNAVKSLYEAINDDTGLEPSGYDPLFDKYDIYKIVNLLREHDYKIRKISVSDKNGIPSSPIYNVLIQGLERGEKNYIGHLIEVRIVILPNSNEQFSGIIYLIDDDTHFVCQDGTAQDIKNTGNNCEYTTADDMCMALENFFTQHTKQKQAETEPWTEEQKQAALRDWGDLQLSNDIRNMFID